jgi:flagellar protein FlaG
MSIQSTGLSTTGIFNSSGFATSPPVQIRQVTPAAVDLPKVEVKPANAGVELLQEAVDQANKMFTQIQSDVQFVFDKDSNKVVVKLVEQGTGVVINQYPTDHAIAISHAIAQMQQNTANLHASFKSNSGLQGLLFKQKS